MKLNEVVERKESCWAVITNSQNRFLVAVRSIEGSNPDQWNFFGGSKEPGEEPISCVLRELKEEANIVVSELDVLDYTVIEDDSTAFHYFMFNLDATPELNKEHVEYEWVNKYDLMQRKLHPPTELFFKR